MLRTADDTTIHVGMELPGSLRDGAGNVLLDAGTRVDEATYELFKKRLISGEVYVDDDWPEDLLPPETPPNAPQPSVNASPQREAVTVLDVADAIDKNRRCIPASALRVGLQVSQDLHDEQGVLLLAAGNKITPRFLHLLGQRGILSLSLPPAALAHETNTPKDLASRRVDDQLESAIRNQPELILGQPWRRGKLKLADLEAEARRGLEAHANASDLIANMSESLMAGHSVAIDNLDSAVQQFLNMLTLDASLLPAIIGMQQSTGEYLMDHSVNVALLAMSMGAQVGLAHEQVIEIGLGAALQDVGMLEVPEEIRLAPRQLTESEWNEVQSHPIHTLDLLEQMDGLSMIARFIGYQGHERVDGGGYPRNRTATTIHPFAKMVSIADAYAAMTRPRPHRTAIGPHDAVKKLLHDVKNQQLDTALIRSFLDCVSAFPVGSYVVLNNDAIAKVVRANPGMHTRPVVVECDFEGDPTGTVIDLAQEPGYDIVSVPEDDDDQ